MIERFEVEDRHDRRLVPGLGGLLGDFNRAGVLAAADVHTAARLGELAGVDDERLRLGVALAVRAARHGSVCVDLATIRDGDDLPWPDPAGWAEDLAASAFAAASVVRVEHGLVYLDRYWREEGQVRDDLVRRTSAPPPAVDERLLSQHAARLFPDEGSADQRAVALAAARQWTTVLTGGPGTGKTTTVAGLLALLAAEAAAGPSPRELRIALTAPTGKAAARLLESVREAQERPGAPFDADDRCRLEGLGATTMHRLLGWRPDSGTRFRHHRGNTLPHDVVVVDETSMVSLTMMARLLEAVRADTRLVLVGDPDQLASVEAGAVLADLVGGLAGRAPAAVARLTTTRRYGAAIGGLAQALRDGDADQVLERLDGTPAGAGATDPRVLRLDPEEPATLEELRGRLLAQARALHALARDGRPTEALALLEEHRLLCAHRDGPHGARHWNALVERLLGEELGTPLGGPGGPEWYAGRPVLVTSNDYGLGLFNGDTGVVVRAGEDLRVVVAGAGVPAYATSRLADVETLHAMTVHKSQGSQARHVTVLLPPEESPLLTRELLYTAVTRARESVRVVATEAAVRAAVGRRVQRASGLRPRLAGDERPGDAPARP